MQLNDMAVGVYENHGTSCLAPSNSPSSTMFELVSGHARKIEGNPAKQNNRAIGRESLPLLLGALWLELAVMRVEARIGNPQVRQALDRRGREKNFMTRRGRKGACKVSAMKTREDLRVSARHAAQSRWEKHRAEQKRQPKGRGERSSCQRFWWGI
jgi:hypothetical protein